MQLIGEPAATQADLHFRLFGIPVRVHPFFWVVTLLLGMGGGGPADPVMVLIWVAVVFVSILVHEFGHAFVQRYFGGHPWVTLYSFGGLASCNDCDRSPRAQLLISFAGPLAGFLFAGVIVLALMALGRFQGMVLDWIPVRWELFGSWIDIAIFYLLFVNIIWGLVNLLPIYPLDGGQISREIFTLGNARNGIVQSLWLSAVCGAAVAVFALIRGQFYAGIMFGLLAFGNYQTLQRYRDHYRY
jgi:Zn-dependent protease